MYAFVSHGSACESLRLLSTTNSLSALPRWPSEPRALPYMGECVSNQRTFKEFRAAHDLARFGACSGPVDLLVPDQRMRSSGKSARFHVWSSPVKPGWFIRVENDVLVSSPEFAILQLCGSQAKFNEVFEAHVRAYRKRLAAFQSLGIDEKPAVDHPVKWEQSRRLIAAALVACEFAGTYRLAVGDKATTYGASPLIACDSLREAAGPKTTTVSRRAHHVARVMLEGSASPMETSLGLILTLPVDLGGYGIKKPLLNVPICIDGGAADFLGQQEIRPDFLWAEERVALEYDSAEFHSEKGAALAARDAARANALTALGYRVLRVTPQLISSPTGLDLLAAQLASALGCELRPPTPVEELRRREVFSLLFPNLLA